MLVRGVLSSITYYDEITEKLEQRSKAVKEKVKRDDEEQKASDNWSWGDSELLGGHEGTDLDWTLPTDGGPSFQESLDEIDTNTREISDKARLVMLECLMKAKGDADKGMRCINKARPKPQGITSSEYNSLQSADLWDEAVNVYRLNTAEIHLEAIEKLFGEFPIDEPFKVQIETALRLHDATELDKRYIREGEKL